MANLVKRTKGVYPFTMGGFYEVEVTHEYENGRKVHFLQRVYTDSKSRVLHVTNIPATCTMLNPESERRYYYRNHSGVLTSNDHYGK